MSDLPLNKISIYSGDGFRTAVYTYVFPVFYTLGTVFGNHKKVSFNIASEASYAFILSGQKFMKMVKETKIGEKYQNSNATFLVIFKQCDGRPLSHVL